MIQATEKQRITTLQELKPGALITMRQLDGSPKGQYAVKVVAVSDHYAVLSTKSFKTGEERVFSAYPSDLTDTMYLCTPKHDND